MIFQIQCPCGKVLNARHEHAGHQVVCPSCQQRLIVPGAPVAQSPAPPPVAPPPMHSPVSPPAKNWNKPAADSNRTLIIGGLIAIGLVALVVVALAGLYMLQQSNRVADKRAEEQEQVGALSSNTKRAVAETSTRANQSTSPSDTFQSASQSASPASSGVSATTMSLADLIEIVEPSVVRLDVKSNEGESIGSGFFVGDEGVIVTNYHVVQGARQVMATTSDGKKAYVKGFYHADPARDLAVVKVNANELPIDPLPLAVNLPRKGDDVAAFGSPLGFSFSATEGVISALRSGTEISKILKDMSGVDIYAMKGISKSTDWIQTTAAISGGNSGGPLVNMRGELVGVNTWQSPEGQNLNFATTVDEVRKVLQTTNGARPERICSAAVEARSNHLSPESVFPIGAAAGQIAAFHYRSSFPSRISIRLSLGVWTSQQPQPVEPAIGGFDRWHDEPCGAIIGRRFISRGQAGRSSVAFRIN